MCIAVCALGAFYRLAVVSSLASVGRPCPSHLRTGRMVQQTAAVNANSVVVCIRTHTSLCHSEVLTSSARSLIDTSDVHFCAEQPLAF
ncbi:unnamed protein product [Toxocara canis]|uniref:Secreted protein n=1 Tax=Toxocara canis TaxID=6265 RepID=A0A183VBD6_TOXCA|nr:unnamed protein product [Toxocara canis]